MYWDSGAPGGETMVQSGMTLPEAIRRAAEFKKNGYEVSLIIECPEVMEKYYGSAH